MITLATILDNPGEPPAETGYRDLHQLRKLGYNGLATYRTTALSGLLGPDTVASGDHRRWVAEQFDHLKQNAADARAASMDLWLAYDAPTLSTELVGSAMTCINQPHVLCPGSDELLDMVEQCVEATLSAVPSAEGLVLRLGDSDAHRLSHLVGNDLYTPHCARCASLGRADRLVRYITRFHDLVVNKLGRRLIVRAWNVKPGGLHDSEELCRRVVEQLPDDDRLILSFKFTQTDFWRYQKWNPSSLVCGDRPIIYELQCQREFEAKGATPNFQAPLWRDGMGELDGAIGLAEAAGKVNLAGVWAWVRGGGWGGPFVSHETWIDANVVVAPRLAENPKADPIALARDWVDQRLECGSSQARSAIVKVLTDSPAMALGAFYIGPYALSREDPWHPSGHFMQDDQISAEAAWTMIQRLPDAVLDEAVEQKRQAMDLISTARRQLQQVAGEVDRPSGESLVNSMQYYESLVETLLHLVQGLVAWRRLHRRGGATSTRGVLEAFSLCQNYWNHHQRYANLRGTASAFRSDDLWDFTQNLIDQAREREV